jgi:hypothetical protein
VFCVWQPLKLKLDCSQGPNNKINSWTRPSRMFFFISFCLVTFIVLSFFEVIWIWLLLREILMSRLSLISVLWRNLETIQRNELRCTVK